MFLQPLRQELIRGNISYPTSSKFLDFKIHLLIFSALLCSFLFDFCSLSLVSSPHFFISSGLNPSAVLTLVSYRIKGTDRLVKLNMHAVLWTNFLGLIWDINFLKICKSWIWAQSRRSKSYFWVDKFSEMFY